MEAHPRSPYAGIAGFLRIQPMVACSLVFLVPGFTASPLCVYNPHATRVTGAGTDEYTECNPIRGNQSRTSASE